jgi:hypothetical protein
MTAAVAAAWVLAVPAPAVRFRAVAVAVAVAAELADPVAPAARVPMAALAARPLLASVELAAKRTETLYSLARAVRSLMARTVVAAAELAATEMCREVIRESTAVAVAVAVAGLAVTTCQPAGIRARTVAILLPV